MQKGNEPQPQNQPNGQNHVVNSDTYTALIRKFPCIFDQDNKNIRLCLPIGWAKYIENAFRAFEATGVRVSVSSIDLISNMPMAREERDERHGGRSAAVQMLNAFMAGAANLCVICGQPMPRGSLFKESLDFDEDDDFMASINKKGHASIISQEKLACPQCLKKYGLATERARPGNLKKK